MPSLPHLMFGVAIAVLIAIALALVLPGREEGSRPQQAQITSSRVPIQ
jgi:hypothetical protein